jgi:hypothetical protein
MPARSKASETEKNAEAEVRGTDSKHEIYSLGAAPGALERPIRLGQE